MDSMFYQLVFDLAQHQTAMISLCLFVAAVALAPVDGGVDMFTAQGLLTCCLQLFTVCIEENCILNFNDDPVSESL